MIHVQTNIPLHASVGDAWTDEKSFKRVLSRGGAWENVNLGSTHPDEVDHEQAKQRAEAEQRNDGTEVSGRAGEPAPGDGDDGETTFVSGLREEDTGVVNEPAGHETNDDVSSDGEPLTSTGSIEDGTETRAEGEARREGIDSDPDRVV